MKHSAILVLLLMVSIPVFGQEDITNKTQKNQLSLVLVDVVNGTYTFNYERAIGNHISVGLGIGYKTDEGLISLSGLDTDQLKTGDITYSGPKFVPEFRYYVNDSGNGMLSGFYVGAYLKNSYFKSELSGTFIDAMDVSYSVVYEAKIRVSSLGLLIGYKLPVSKRFSIDFLIAGPGSGSYSFKMKNIVEPPEEFYEALNEALEEYSILDLINSDFDFSSHNLETNFNAPSFRYGISLGYSF